MVNRKRLAIVVLLFAFIFNCTAAWAEESDIMPLMNTEERYYIYGGSPELGNRYFWFRFSHSCDLTQNNGSAYAKNHAVRLYKLPVDNLIPPELGGNGIMLFLGVKAYTNAGSEVDFTRVSGDYGATIDPKGTIDFYRARSTSSEYLTVPYNGMKYYLRANIMLQLPSDYIHMGTNYSDTPKTYFY